MSLFGHFVLVLSFCLWTAGPSRTAAWGTAEGQPQVIGPRQPIVAAPGDDVILPCYLEPHLNVEALTVEWSKPDLTWDPSDKLRRVPYVHLYRRGGEDLSMKIRSYVGRTKMFTGESDGLKSGNVSLLIQNVSLEDEARYRCFLPKLQSSVSACEVRLVVDPNSVRSRTPETPLPPRHLPTPGPAEEGGRPGRVAWISALVLGVGASLAAALSVTLFKYKRKRDLPKCDVAPETPLTA